MGWARATALGLFLFAFTGSARAQGWTRASGDVDLTPLGGHDIWSRIHARDGGPLWHVWSRSGEVWLQRRDRVTLAPAGAPIHVNITTHLQQDEPELIVLDDGRVVVAWSDRSSQWAQYMSCQVAIFDESGALLLPETPMWSNAAAAQTNWRPMLDRTREGGFVAAWTAGWGEKSYARVFDGDGTPLAPEFPLQPPSSAKQNSPDIAQGRGGTWFVAYHDGASATPKDVRLRWLEPAGTIGATTAMFDQPTSSWDARTATDAKGLAVATWGAPGDGQDVWLARTDAAGHELEGPLLVGGGPGEQRNPELELADRTGGLLAFEDRALNRVVVVEIDLRGRPGASWPAHLQALGPTWSGETGRRIPDVWVSRDGREAIVAWTAAAPSGADQDGWAARFVRD